MTEIIYITPDKKYAVRVSPEKALAPNSAERRALSDYLNLHPKGEKLTPMQECDLIARIALRDFIGRHTQGFHSIEPPELNEISDQSLLRHSGWDKQPDYQNARVCDLSRCKQFCNERI